MQYEEGEEEEDGSTILLEPISNSRALQTLQGLRRYEEEEHLDGDLELLRVLKQYERKLAKCVQSSKQQCTIDSFFYF